MTSLIHVPSRMFTIKRDPSDKVTETVFADVIAYTDSGIITFANLIENPHGDPIQRIVLSVPAWAWCEVREVTDEMAMKGLH